MFRCVPKVGGRILNWLSSRHTSPMVLEHTTTERLTPTQDRVAAAVLRSAAGYREQSSRNGDLGHLEGDITAVADDLRADLDEFFLQARQ
jgi:hypothetical protein